MKIVNLVKAKTRSMFYGWRVTIAASVINAFGAGTFFYGFSTFFDPMIAEFGWSRTVMSGAFSLSRLEGGIEGPIAGWLIDKFGSRKILFIGVLISGLGFCALWFVNSPLSLYLIFGLFLSVGYNLGFTSATTAAVAKWFVKKRGRALSYVFGGNGVGGAIFVPLIAWLIVTFDWRWAAVIIGVGTLVIVLPLTLVIKNSPEEMGMVPDGTTAEPEKQTKKTSAGALMLSDIDFTVKEALKTPSFWIYTVAMTFRACILSSLVIHQIPHLTDIGISYQVASFILGMMVLISIPGRFLFGWMGDHVNKKMLIFALCILQAVGIFIFIHAGTMSMLYLFVAIYGIGYGGMIPLTIALRADLFGRKNYASIAGMTMPITMIGTVTAPLVAGYLYDVTQSYDIIFYVFVGLITVSGFLFLFIPRPAPPKRLRPTEDTSDKNIIVSPA